MKRILKAIRSTVILTLVLVFAESFDYQEGNSIEILYCGQQFYPALFESIESAEKYIYMEYYAIRQDRISESLLELLARKAEEGLEVRLILDPTGCSMENPQIGESSLDDCRQRGVSIVEFNDGKFYAPFPRDHRKLFIIDGRTAYVGGINFDDRNIWGDSTLGTVKDMAVKVKGTVLAELMECWLESWGMCGEPAILKVPEVDTTACGDIEIAVADTFGIKGETTPEDIYLELIGQAEKRIRLVNAYFTPSGKIKRALRKAARRGVSVEILIGGNTDLPGIIAGQPYRTADRLDREEGISCHILEGAFIHEKAVSIDDAILMAGSTNLDFLSRKINWELSLIIRSTDVTKAFNAIFDSEFAK